jgi:hypothetical protein
LGQLGEEAAALIDAMFDDRREQPRPIAQIGGQV